MSNHLVIGARRSKSGFPLLIGGPQAGYFSPQILMDYELHSPTIHARGAGFPGLSAIVVMGRTERYAWTPTAGGSGHDRHLRREAVRSRRAARPSEDSRFYEFKGECRPMDRRTAARCAAGCAVSRTSSSSAPCTGRCCRAERSTASRSLSSTSAPPTARSSTPAISILRMNRGEATTGEEVHLDLPRVAQPLDELELRQTSARSATCTAASTRSARPGRIPTSRSGAPASGSGRRTRRARTSTSAAAPSRTRRTRSAASRSRGTTARRRAGPRPTASGATARSTAASCSRTRSARRSRTRSRPCGSCR